MKLAYNNNNIDEDDIKMTNSEDTVLCNNTQMDDTFNDVDELLRLVKSLTDMNIEVQTVAVGIASCVIKQRFQTKDETVKDESIPKRALNYYDRAKQLTASSK